MRAHPIIFLPLLIVAFCAGISKGNQKDILHPSYLRCEYLVNPLGIDVVTPRLSWYSVSDRRNEKQTSYRILVASSLRKLNADDGDLWDSKKIASDESINVIYAGKELLSGEECFWKVKVWHNHGTESEWSEPAKWSMGLLKSTDWKGYWVGLDSAIGTDNPDSEHTRLSARYLSKQFDASNKTKRATIYVCGLGLFELHINGHKIGDQVLAPALSEYPKRSYYITFDVTKYIVGGKNEIGVILGNGRFFAPRHMVPTKTINYGFPKMISQLVIENEDNSTQYIVSDTTWKITTDGPITSNNEYDGEAYDARKEMSGWDKTDFDDSNWKNAKRVASPSDELSAQMINPIKVMQNLVPKSMRQVKPGVYVYDMGQNMVGWVSLKVRTSNSTKIKMRFAETLRPDGNLYTANLRSAEQTDTYITGGKGLERWEPILTYHGFRYVELTGYPGNADLGTIRGRVVYDDVRTVGSFSCSSDIMNRIYHAAYWGIRGNYRSIPTDCPQRDERQGWLGDRSTNSYGETFLFDNNALYSKWVTDIADAQEPGGSIPDVAPAYWPIYTDNMTWPSSFIIIPGTLYRQFANISVIARNYDRMKKWLFYMRDNYMKNYLLPRDTYGDWCMPPEKPELIHSEDPNRITPGDFIGSAYFYYCLTVMEGYSHLLNKVQDSVEYASLAEKVRHAIDITYLNRDSLCYSNNTVTANLLALSFHLSPDDLAKNVFEHLLYKTVHENKTHVSTGLVGGQWMMRGLTDYGRTEVAVRLAENKDYPSWGYMIENAATTIWELWNGNTAAPDMNSGNHVMLLGDLLVWYYEDLAGIKADIDSPAFKHIFMDPHPAGDVRFVKASYLSMYGLIKSYWRREEDKFSWDIDIPANTTATIYIPSHSESAVTESGRNASVASGVKFLSFENGRAIYEIGSGSYHFVSIIHK